MTGEPGTVHSMTNEPVTIGRVVHVHNGSDACWKADVLGVPESHSDDQRAILEIHPPAGLVETRTLPFNPAPSEADPNEGQPLDSAVPRTKVAITAPATMSWHWPRACPFGR